jgi:hypothetical protein
MQVKQSEICTNGPWRMRTGHANRIWWILGRCTVVCVKAWKMWECKNAKCEICKNTKHMRYASMWNAKCVGSWNMQNHKMCKICKIVKTAALQQVQYKVLQYGLYAPIETWVSTPVNYFVAQSFVFWSIFQLSLWQLSSLWISNNSWWWIEHQVHY